MKTVLRLLAASFFLLFGCVILGAQTPRAERFFSDMVETFGVPEGVGELTGPQARRERHYLFRYDSKGRVVRVESREPGGQIWSDFFHVRVLTFEYDEAGSLLRRAWRSPEGTAELVWRYEGPDRVFFEKAFLGELPPLDFMPFRDGLFQNISDCNPDLTVCGNLAGLSLVRDDRGQVVRVDFLRADGEQGFDPQETAGHRYERDELGRFTKAVLLNGKGEPHTDSFGVSEYRLRYEGNYLAEIGCYGLDGKPVNNNRGFAFLRQEIPGPGLYKTAFFGVNGEPVTNRQDGYSFCITRTRSDGRPDTIAYYGPDGLPCAAIRGASQLDIHYPDRYTEEIRLISPDGLLPSSGFQRIRVFRNRFGRVTRREFFPDESDEPGEIWIDTLSKKGLLKVREIRTPNGIVGRIREVRRADGSLSARISMNSEGQVVSEEHFGYDRLGNCLKYWNTADGGFRWELDEDGRQVKRFELNTKGKDTGMSAAMTYDGSGRFRTQTVLSDKTDDPFSEIRKTVYTWNARGDLVREDFFCADGTPPKRGPASIIREYDERGNECLIRGVTASGAPALLPRTSYTEVRRTFDGRDNMIAVMWLDRDLLPVFQSGFLPVFEDLSAAIVRMQYDLAGNLIRAELFPEDEIGFSDFGGAAEIRFERKRLHDGEEVLLSFYDLSGNPFHAFGGSSTALRFRETDGEERFTFLDENMEKVLEPSLGYAEKVTDETGTTRYYDENGNLVTPAGSEDGDESETKKDGSKGRNER